MEYRGVEIDGSILKSEKDVDEFLERLTVDRLKVATEIFAYKEGCESPFSNRFPQGNPFFVSVTLLAILFRYLCAKFSTRVCEFVS